MTVLGLALGGLVGITLGLLGGGGSILTVPILVYTAGFPPKEAIALSLAVVGITAGVGVWSHWRAGNVDGRAALIFGPVAMAGTWLGARLSVFLSGATQLLLFAVVMLLAAVLMLRAPAGTDATRTAPPAKARAALLAAEGLGVGVLTGIVGVGGGFLIVPALVLLAGIPMKRAVGTSLAIIALKSVAGFAGYLGIVPIDWEFLLLFTLFAIGGIGIGSSLVPHVPATALRRIFAGLLLVVGTWILFENREVLLPHPLPAATAPVAQPSS